MRTRARDSVVMDQMGRYEQTMRESVPKDRVCDQAYIKQFNIQSVLAMLKQYQPVSRTDIARLTGMSPTSITRIITALLNQGIIYETSGEQRSGRGRKATNLRVNADGIYTVGIHLERSVIRLCVLNFADQALYRGEALVDGECTPEKMAQTAKMLFERMPEGTVEDPARIRAVGVSLSGAVNHWKGFVSNSIMMQWRDVDLKAVFSKAFGMTACIENDVKACLIGEKVRMGIPDATDTAYLLVGAPGVGLASTSGGVLVRGEKNEAGEIASVPIGRKPDGSLDYYGRHLVEGGLIKRAREYDASVHSVDAIAAAKEQGKEWAAELIEDFRKYLEIAVLMIDGIYNPSQIIVGGAICHKLYPDITESTGRDYVRLGDDYEESCMTGAALVAMRSAVIELIGENIE